MRDAGGIPGGAERSDGGRGVWPRTMFSITFPCPATPLPSPQGKVPSTAMAEEVFGLERCFPSRFPVLPHPCLPPRGRCRAQRWRKRCSASNDVFHHVSLSCHPPAFPSGEGAERSDGGRGVRPRTMFSITFPCPATPLSSPQGKVPSAAMAEEVFGLERCFPSRFPVPPHC